MKIIATDRAGREHVLEGQDGLKMMEVLRDQGMGVEGACGGECSCATCHVYLTDGWFARLAPPAPGEIEVLDTAVAVAANSRLACQIICGPDVDGIRLTVAPAP